MAVRLAAAGAHGNAGILAEGFFPAYAGGEIPARDDPHSRIDQTYVKMHGGCRGNHAPLDAFLSIMREHSLAADTVRRVLVHVDRHTLAAEVEHPRTPEQAQFSIAFALAVAAIHGETSVFAFTEARLNDARVRDLMGRIRVVHDPELDPGYPARRAARVEVVGETSRYAARVDYPVGEPENPVSASALCSKFEELAAPVLGEDTARVRDYVLDMERASSLVPLLDALGRARERHDHALASVKARDAAVAS
jgi:2-methylcitrate dehydratase PrpD